MKLNIKKHFFNFSLGPGFFIFKNAGQYSLKTSSKLFFSKQCKTIKCFFRLRKITLGTFMRSWAAKQPFENDEKLVKKYQIKYSFIGQTKAQPQNLCNRVAPVHDYVF